MQLTGCVMYIIVRSAIASHSIRSEPLHVHISFCLSVQCSSIMECPNGDAVGQ